MVNFDLSSEDLVSVGVSIICGGLLGFEREYQNKTAGFRTIILICLGATIFTLVSRYALGQADDRIAANIVTGIGFIGAGVIFKDTNLWVKGLTTAAVIWVSAAIGMMSGMRYHLFALLLAGVVVLVLSIFYRVEELIDRFHHRRQFTVTFIDTDLQHLHELEQIILMRGIKTKRMQVAKIETGNLWVILDVSGNKEKIKNLNEHMVNLPEIRSFQVL
jgi:putative Mg2+ transporter-C (MgtC) family protein